MRKIIYGLDEIKLKISSLKGQNIQMDINRGRKKIETIEAIIKDIYPSVFTIKTADEKLQTFSYFDVMCGNVVFNELP
ncbi:MAG: Veg family protein [Clostridia bacterium]|nr:Veg family protein [Clostridia bacterium]